MSMCGGGVQASPSYFRVMCICKNKKKSRVNACVVLCCNIMSDKCEVSKVEVPKLAYSYRKAPREPLGLTSSSGGTISINRRIF